MICLNLFSKFNNNKPVKLYQITVTFLVLLEAANKPCHHYF
jgi:hypothetical protein